MSIFSKTSIGKIVKVTDGLLKGKYVMIAKEYDKGYGVVTDPSDWPSEVPIEFNAVYLPFDRVVDITKDEETMLSLKFPRPDEFE